MGVTVAIDETPLAGPRTGIGQYVRHVIDALASVEDPPQLRPWVLSRRAVNLGAQVTRLPYPAGMVVRLWGRADWPSATRATRAVDVVHGTNYVVPPSRLPMVVSVHDCTLVTHPAWCPPAVRHFAAVVRRAAARGAWLQTPSTYVADQARDVFGTDRVRVVPYGPPDPPGALDSAGDIPGLESVPFVLALGKLEARKNLPRLVEAFGRLHPRQPELHLVLAGPDGPDRLAIDAAISRLPRQAARQVIITGWLDFAHRDWALRRAAALAYPSLDEGFGFPVLEAMQRGVPVVAANVGSLPEVSGDAAVLIDPHDIDALAAALELVLTNEGRRHNLIELGHRHVSTFSWHDCAEGMNVLYRNAVDAGR